MTLGQEEIQRKQRTDPDFWLRRPLPAFSLTYASFKITQLEALYKHYLDKISEHPHITVESQRYLELYKDERPPPNIWFIDHNVLPQEILERDEEIHQRYDELGTRECAGCRRDLHQDSFRESFKRRWTLRLGEHGRLCYTCQEARRRRESESNTPQSRWLPIITTIS